MRIPHTALQGDTLLALIESFIDREGTDYGETEASRETMIRQILAQVEQGKVVICFDPDTESCTLLPHEQAPLE